MKKLVSIISVFFIIVFILPTYSLGGNQSFCKTYANKAVDQYSQGKQQNLPGIFPPAWSNDRNGHYRWCMGTPENIVSNENTKRQAYLDKHKPKGTSNSVGPNKQSFCKTYANKAVDQYNQGKQKNLPGIVPPSWSNDRNGHYRWCMGTPENIVSNENTKRQAYLDKHKPKGTSGGNLMTGSTTITTPLGIPNLGGMLAVPKVNQSYIGCFKDQKNRDLSGYHFNNKKMTVGMCLKECEKRGFKYAGTQYSSYCFCGNEYATGGKSSNCNMPCAGNKKETCGGNWANSVYRVKNTSTKIVPPQNSRTGVRKLVPSDALIKKVNDLQNRFNAMAANKLKNYNNHLSRQIRNSVAKQKKINANAFKALPTPDQISQKVFSSIPSDGKAYLIDFSEYEAIPRKKGDAIRLQRKKKTTPSISIKQQSQNLLTPLRPILYSKNISIDGLSDIVTFPGGEVLMPGSWVYISGIGFGNTPGMIELKYNVSVVEISEKWIEHIIPIEMGTHQMKWKNNLIAFKLPDILPDVNQNALSRARGMGKAVLTLKLNNGKNISRMVKLKPATMTIDDIWTDSSLPLSSYSFHKEDNRWVEFYNYPPKKYFWTKMPVKYNKKGSNINAIIRSIEPGSEVRILGSGFLNTSGKVEIMVGGRKLPINNLNWTNNSISFEVGDLPGSLSRENASLLITNTLGESFVSPGVGFVYGPEMSKKIVSGEKWFSPEWDEDTSFAKADSQDLILFVSHDPGCGWFSTSESGWDYFFHKKKLPDGVVLTDFIFIEIPHKDSQDQLKYLIEYFESVLTEGDVMGFITHGFKMLANHAIDSIFGDGGGHYAYIPIPPKGNVDVPIVGIRWENSCNGPAAELPIIYTTSFTVIGPKTILDSM